MMLLLKVIKKWDLKYKKPIILSKLKFLSTELIFYTNAILQKI